MNEQKSDINKAQLLQGPVGETLIAIAMPVAFGIVAIILFTVVDTFYIGRLGAKPLAAMGFIFPISYIVIGVAMGLSVATSSTIARAIEDGYQPQVQRLVTDGLGLAVLIVALLSFIGLTNLNTIFSLMGAEEEMLVLISDYMVPWCLGVGLLVISMVSNSAIRTTGDIKTPATIMIIAGIGEYRFRSIFDFRHRSLSTIGVTRCGIGDSDFLGDRIHCVIVDFGEA